MIGFFDPEVQATRNYLYNQCEGKCYGYCSEGYECRIFGALRKSIGN
ncbi:hypothetical protein VCR29J2_960045 [Vibrio coralliirubri]|nr:hypothetical protein VCR29J2_960045 [Vibrio coralliirubri]